MKLTANCLPRLNDLIHLKLTKNTIFILIFLPFSFSTMAIEDEPIEKLPASQQLTNDLAASISWPVNLQKLSQRNNADEVIWLEVKNDKLLVLKYWAKGEVRRGNIILLPTEGENPDHPRIIHPLTIQLSQLGWQVYVPTLPLEDYSTLINQSEVVETEKNVEPDNQKVATPAEEPPKLIKSFFNSTNEYQNFIDLSIKNIVKAIEPLPGQLMIIGDQKSAYWILNSTKQMTAITQVILLEPQLPKSIDKNLKIIFEEQSLPVYTFIKSDELSHPFTQAFEQKQWQSFNQRLSDNFLDSSNLALENIRLAKAITGWSESIKKQPK